MDCTNHAFLNNRSVGRNGLLGILTGMTFAFSLATFVFTTICRSYLLTAPAKMLSSVQQFSLYFTMLALFHILEFLVTALYNPGMCTSTSFIVDHSTAYSAALAFSLVEYGVRFLLATLGVISFPGLRFPEYFGLVLVVGGQALRFLAMKKCGESFNHIIQDKKKDNHVLGESS